MGAINYKTSDYITMAINTSIFDDCDDCEKQIMHNDFRDAFEEIIDEYSFDYFNITLEAGYYEGLQICIENYLPLYFGYYDEKRDAQKEVTEIKALLIECMNAGMNVTFPGWSTGYGNETETKSAINKAVSAMRREISETKTYTQYLRDCA